MMGWRRASMARIVPFVLFMAFLALRGFVADHPAWGIDARWIYGAGVVVVAASLVFYARDYAELGRGSAPSLINVLIAAAVGAAVFWMWIHLDRDWMQQDHWTRLIGLGGKAGEATATFTPVDAQGHILWPLVIVRWIGATLLVPVMEELFWRSFIMRWIDKPEFEEVDPRAASWKAVLGSSGLFMLAHPLWLAAVITGVIYAQLYRRTGTLWAPIIAHAVTNGVLGIWVVATGQWQFW